MTELVVVATPAHAPGFRLGGARTLTAGSPEQVLVAVAVAIEDAEVAVVAVDGELWAAVPPPVRSVWAQRARPLIVTIPDTDGDVAAARDAALRDLLARAVGYQITFAPHGGTQ